MTQRRLRPAQGGRFMPPVDARARSTMDGSPLEPVTLGDHEGTRPIPPRRHFVVNVGPLERFRVEGESWDTTILRLVDEVKRARSKIDEPCNCGKCSGTAMIAGGVRAGDTVRVTYSTPETGSIADAVQKVLDAHLMQPVDEELERERKRLVGKRVRCRVVGCGCGLEGVADRVVRLYAGVVASINDAQWSTDTLEPVPDEKPLRVESLAVGERFGFVNQPGTGIPSRETTFTKANDGMCVGDLGGTWLATSWWEVVRV